MTLQASSLPLPGGHCTACCVLSYHCHFHHFAALQNYVARAGIKRCNQFTLVYLLRQKVSYPSLASIASYTVDIVLLSASIPVITINVAISSMTIPARKQRTLAHLFCGKHFYHRIRHPVFVVALRPSSGAR